MNRRSGRFFRDRKGEKESPKAAMNRRTSNGPPLFPAGLVAQRRARNEFRGDGRCEIILPGPSAPRGTPMRFVTPSTLIFAVVLFLLPWVEVRCETRTDSGGI